MLKGKGADSKIVTLKVPQNKRLKIKEFDLPQKITVRFVRVQLKTGENEVLVTSLLDETEFPSENFLYIYHLRWGTEGFYAILKTRLNLENFSGKTAESVYQDFYSTVYYRYLESILTADVFAHLAEKPTKNKQQVNRVVSFNAIKNQAVELLCSNFAADKVIKRLERLFLTHPVSIRNERKVPRKKRSTRHLFNYAKRQRKITF